MRAFERAIEEKRQQIAEKLGDGGIADWPAYRSQVGERKGLREALELAREVAEQLIESDEEEHQ